MIKLFVVVLVLCFCLQVKAQHIPISRYDTTGSYQADLILKFAPLSLIDYNQSIQFALEYKVKPRITFQNELGYITTLMKDLYPYENFRNMRGVRTRIEARFYQKNVLNEVRGFYLAPEVFFVHTNYERTSELGRGCNDWECDYYELKKYNVNKNVFGYHFKLGYQKISYENIVIDIYGGIGLRHVFINVPDVEIEQATLEEGSDILPAWGPYNKGAFTRYSMSLGVKLGYILKRKKSFI